MSDLKELGRERLRKYQLLQQQRKAGLSALEGSPAAIGGANAEVPIIPRSVATPPPNGGSPEPPIERLYTSSTYSNRGSIVGQDDYIAMLLEEKSEMLDRISLLESRLSVALADLKNQSNSTLSPTEANLAQLQEELRHTLSERNYLAEREKILLEQLKSLEVQFQSLHKQQQQYELQQHSAPSPPSSMVVDIEEYLKTISQLERSNEGLNARVDDMWSQLLKQEELTRQEASVSAALRDDLSILQRDLEDVRSALVISSEKIIALEEDIVAVRQEGELRVSEVVAERDAVSNQCEMFVAAKDTELQNLELRIRDAIAEKEAAIAQCTACVNTISDLKIENKALLVQLKELRDRNVVLTDEKAACSDLLFEERRKSDSLSAEVAALKAGSEDFQNVLSLVNTLQGTQRPQAAVIPSEFLTNYVNSLISVNQTLEKSLEEEKRLTTLLSAEVSVLPEYIDIFHKERLRLKARASTAGASQAELDSGELPSPQRKSVAAAHSLTRAESIGVVVVDEFSPCKNCSSRVIII